MKKISTLFIVLIIFGSCSKFEESINVNPNLPSETSGMQLISSASFSLPSLISTPQGTFLAQYLAETQFVTSSLYPEGGTDFYWYYEGPLMDLQMVIDQPELLSNIDGPLENQLAVAKILKAFFFWQMTDRWGDIPYTESLQGINVIAPVYDTQESIYKSLFTLLEEANNQIVVGGITNDVIYGGDMAKWKKLANTIRLLMALRLSEVDSALAEEEFNQALSAGIITSNDDNFTFRHLAEASMQNYWYGQIVDRNREWWALTENLVEEMKPVNDPRLEVYGNPASATGEFVGLPYGTTDGSVLGTTEYSLLGSDIYAQDAPVYLLTNAQALFAKAEAAARGWINEDSEALYNMAIEQSVLQWTGTTEGIETFLEQPDVAFNSADAVELISTQRWIHLYMDGYAAWSSWRRTGYPDNLVSPQGKEVPSRLMYPSNEEFNNTENYQEALDRQFNGSNTLYGKVWWDVD